MPALLPFAPFVLEPSHREIALVDRRRAEKAANVCRRRIDTSNVRMGVSEFVVGRSKEAH